MSGYAKSRAEQLLEQMGQSPPSLSHRVLKSVSSERRDSLESEFLAGKFVEKGTSSTKVSNGSFTPGHVVKGFTKTANTSQSLGQVAGGHVGTSWRGTGDVTRLGPDVYSPLWLMSNLALPRDRTTINAWCRAFYALNGLVQNSINLHSTYPISKLNIKCKNKKVEKFFEEMNEELNLLNICVQVAQEFWTLGETFPYAELDENTGKWSHILIQNPDYIDVQRSVLAGEPIISMRADENLKKVVKGNSPSDIQQRRMINPEIINYVKRDQNIPLNNLYISHLARRISPYDARGTGLIVAAFRPLMLFDKMYESKYVQADAMVNPLTLVKIGDNEFRPGPQDLEQWRTVFEAGENDKNFKVFTHNAVTVERVGWGQAIYDISGDIDKLMSQIYIALMVPRVIMDGQDTTYANGSVALDVLRQRYMQFRNMLSAWLREKIFAPISRIQGFYEYKDKKKVLIVPEIDWNHMSMFDLFDYIGQLNTLLGQEPGKNRISIQTMYRSLGIDYRDERNKIKIEDIEDEIREKEKASLSKLSLTELRSLAESVEQGGEIEESRDAPLPGEDGEEEVPGENESGMPPPTPPPAA
jgi:hypothetical protein